jgi:hypothetical protein
MGYYFLTEFPTVQFLNPEEGRGALLLAFEIDGLDMHSVQCSDASVQIVTTSAGSHLIDKEASVF